MQAMEKNLKPGLKASFRNLVDSDDAEGLQEALEAERSANSKLPSKINKKRGANGCKEEDEFAILGRRLLHYASELDAVECCKLLLRSDNFPHIWVDAVDELDQRSALHVASLNHSKRCIEVLLKKGANVSLKNSHLAVPLEEALLSAKLNVDWNFVTPAVHIVEQVSRKDLAALRTLEGKCKDLLVTVAFKLAKGLKLVPLVALLIVAKSSFVLNFAALKLEGGEESVGTLVDFLVGKVLTSSSGCSLDKVTLNCENPDGAEVVANSKIGSDSSSWESRFETKFNHLDENSLEIKYKKDANEWEEINSKYSFSMGSEGASSSSDSKSRRSCSARDEDWKGVFKSVHDDCAATGEDVETNFKIARKLLECVLLFNPRLSAHPQSPAQPPLLRAAQANDEDLLSLLLKAGAPINEMDSDGNTALHWSLRQTSEPVNKRVFHRTVVKRLLDGGANVLVANKLGATPVHTSAGHGHYEALKLILEKEAGGVNVMAVTKETPLHYSVKNDQLLCTALLLTHGANRNVSNLRSQKPFQLAPSPEMRALLSLDEAALREPPVNLLQSLSIMAKQQAWKEAPFQGSVLNSTGLPESCPNLEFQRAGQQLRINDLDLIDDNGKASVKLPAWKTVFCRRFRTSEGCTWGDNCHFAHSEEELRAGAQILKTAVEKSDEELGLKGFDLDQLVANIGDQGLKNYKSKLCMYHEKGTCALGVRCFFAHGEGELRPISATSSSSEEQDDSSSLGRVFVGGLPRFVHSGELRDFFETEFGKVVHAKIIFGDDEQGRSRSRGFGFVRFEQQKDADEAVKRRCLQLRGKMVEVKRVVARMDSTSGNEVENLSPSFPTEFSSPATPLYSTPSSMYSPSGDEVENLSPSFLSEIASPATPELYSPPSSEPSIGLVNDAVQLPALSTTGPPPGWSIPSLPVEIPRGGLHSSQLLSQRQALPLSQNPSAFLSEQKNLHEANDEQIPPVSNRSLHPHDSAPYSQISGPFAHSDTHSSQNGVQQFPHDNARPQVEINLAPVAESSAESKSRNEPSPLESSQSSSISNVFNGTAPHTSNPHEPFSFFTWRFPESSIPQPHYGSGQSEPAQSSQTNEAADKDLSQLVTMLKDLSPFSLGYDLPYDLAYGSQAPAAFGFVPQASHLEGGHHVFPAQNAARVSPGMYTRDPPHLPENGAPSLMRTYGGVSTPYLPEGFIPAQNVARVSPGMYTRGPPHLPDNGAPSLMRTYGGDFTPYLQEGFSEIFPSPTKYNEVGQASNST